MTSKILFPIVLVFLGSAGCDAAEPEASKPDRPAADVADDEQERASSADEDEPRTKKRRSRSSRSSDEGSESERAARDDQDDEAKEKAPDEESGSGDEKLGIRVCDQYIQRVKGCASGPKDSFVFKKMVAKWREALADGKRSKVKEACEKADEVFKCRT